MIVIAVSSARTTSGWWRTSTPRFVRVMAVVGFAGFGLLRFWIAP